MRDDVTLSQGARGVVACLPWREMLPAFGLSIGCVVLGREQHNLLLVAVGSGAAIATFALFAWTWRIYAALADIRASIDSEIDREGRQASLLPVDVDGGGTRR